MENERTDHERRLAACQIQLLPIWERWTEGNPALRRWLASRRAHLANQETHLRLLVASTLALCKYGIGSPGVQAALLAASASLKAYLGVPDQEWRASVQRALWADLNAEQ